MEPPACPGGTCQLFGLFGLFVQTLIGVWCVLTLLFLWWLETPRRSLTSWFGDMSKQMIGAGWAHFMNVFIALLLGQVETKIANNQCVWYVAGFCCDILFCTFLCWAVNSAVRPRMKQSCGIDIGDYEGHTDDKTDSLNPWMSWILQTAIWMGIMTVVKVLVSVAIFLLQDIIYGSFASLFYHAGLCHHQRAQLLVSVLFLPIIGDAIQFAVQDGFLKSRAASQSYTMLESPIVQSVT